MFLNRSSFAEGEVLLFRTKKSRYRAIPVMKTSFASSSKFSDALTFKEWIKRVHTQDKGNVFRKTKIWDENRAGNDPAFQNNVAIGFFILKNSQQDEFFYNIFKIFENLGACLQLG